MDLKFNVSITQTNYLDHCKEAHIYNMVTGPLKVLLKIIKCVGLKSMTVDRNEVLIPHIVVQGTSKWVLEKNLTKTENIEHMKHNLLVFRGSNGLEKCH